MVTLATAAETDHGAHEEEEEEKEQVMSTLPVEIGWGVPLNQWRGFWFRPLYLDGVITARNNFQPFLDDVFLVSPIKSGTTWLKSLIFSTVNRTLHCPLSAQHPLLATNPHDLVPSLETQVYSSTNPNPDLTTIPSPRLFASHMPYSLLPESVKETGCKIVYVCRNPKDNFVSLWHFVRKLPRVCEGPPVSLEEAFELFCRGVSSFGPPWEHVLEFWKQSLERPHKVLFLKYEELMDDAEFNLRKLARFLGLPFSGEEEEKGTVKEIVTMCNFGNLSNLDVNKIGQRENGVENSAFFRRGVVGDWKNHLTAEMAEKIDQITRLKWHDSGLRVPDLVI